jgi:hypothetical protein
MKDLMLTGWKVESWKVQKFKRSKVYLVMIDDGNEERQQSKWTLPP